MTHNTQPATAAGNSNSWIRVSRQSPCPICHGPDNCEVSADGKWAYCGRVEEGSRRENAGGQHLHLLTDDGGGGDLPPEYAEWQERERQRLQEAAALEPEPEAPAIDWADTADRFYHGAAAQRQHLASTLGVDCGALDALGVGWDGQAFTIPERDGRGNIIGISRRFADGSKRMMKDSKRGLTYSPDWQEDDGPVLVVEGASDTAAGLTLGICTIGRPSNRGGADHLTELLSDLPADRRIIVMGENDEKADGTWPGRDGAVSVAGQIAERLQRPVDWALPPDEAKDLRSWCQSHQGCRDDFARLLKLQVIEPCAQDDGPDQLSRVDHDTESHGQLSSLKVITMSDVEAEPLKWLWPDWLCCGKFHLISGQPGQGKSFALLDLAARLSNGTVWPDGSPVGRPAETLLMCAEDDPADGLRPRLDAANADCSKIHLLQSCSRIDEQGRTRDQPVQIQRDFLEIAHYLKLHPEIRLVIIDPLVEYMTSTDSNSNEQVRAALADLLTVAAETDVAIVAVAHFRKAVSASAIDKSGGSGAFVARARVGMILIRDPEDEGRRMLLQTKNNLAETPEGLAFSIVNSQVHWSASRVTMTADEAVQSKRGPAQTARADAAGWLRDRLQGGRAETRTIDAEAKARGYSIATLNRARKEIGVVAEQDRQDGKPVWFVSLPDVECSVGDF